MRAVITQIRTAVLSRRAQTATVLLVSLLAGIVSTMALTLLVRSHQPWDDAFAQYAGPHLLFHFDATKVSPAQLEATASLPGVTAAGPPRLTALVPFEAGEQKGTFQLIGRDSPGGQIDRLAVVAGRWPEQAGEIALARTQDSSFWIQPHVGQTIRALTPAGTVEFKVVGEVADFCSHGRLLDYSNVAAAAWVLPSGITAIVAAGQFHSSYEMAYRFSRALTANELAADRREIETALPAGAETQYVTDWTQMRASSTWLIDLLSSTIVSFTVFALLAVSVIVASVVAGSVLSNYREIGIAKSLGFTPNQMIEIHAGQMIVPAVIGGLLGVPLGAVASRPFLDDAARSLGLPSPAVFDPTVAIAVGAALALIVFLASLLPTLRAAHADSVRAMVLGTAPGSTRRSWISAALKQFGAPRPLSLGAGDAFARPVRATMTLAALTIGIATATFGIGFQSAFSSLVSDRAAIGFAQDVTVNRYPGMSDDTLTASLAAQPETQLVLGVKAMAIHLPDQTDPAVLYAIRGDAPSLGYRAVSGRWFRDRGEAVIGAAFARNSHVQIGDTVTGSIVGGPVLALRVVGLTNDYITPGYFLKIGWETLSAVMLSAAPDQYLIKLQPGSDSSAYARRIAAIAPDSLDGRATNLAVVNEYMNLLTGMIGGLTLVLLLIAGAGVFNATLLTTRERVRDIAILKTVGMTSRQVALMAIAAIWVLAFAAVCVGLPLGMWLEGVIFDNFGAPYGVALDYSLTFTPLPIGLSLLAAFLVAVAGAAVPARWAAATPVAQVLRSE